MKSYGRYAYGVPILFVLMALSFGLVVAASNVTNETGKAPISIGTNITKIVGISYMGADQRVEIANQGTGTVDLTGWTLMNAENQTYSFPSNFTLKVRSLVYIHSGKGKDTAVDLYNSTLVWNKTRDNATLKDASGRTVSEYKYPVVLKAPTVISGKVPTKGG